MSPSDMLDDPDEGQTVGPDDELPTDLQMAEELDDMDREMTDWEADFMESVLPWLREGHKLSFKQKVCLAKMYRDYQEKGAI